MPSPPDTFAVVGAAGASVELGVWVIASVPPEVEEAASSITGQLQAMSGRLPAGPGVDVALCDTAIAAILPAEDVRFGGFGGAPKFPPSALLEALLRGYERTADAAVLGAPPVPEVKP